MTPEQRDSTIDAAVRLYAMGTKPTLDSVAGDSGVPAVAIRRQYKGFGAILEDYFVRTLEQRDMLLADVPDEASLPLEDRLGTRLFMLLDLLDAEVDFAKATFGKHAARWGSPFREKVDQEIADLLVSSDIPGVNQFTLTWSPVRGVLLEALVQTIRIWLEDDSEDRERATALVDRLLAFFAEVATSRGLERGLDVARYAAGAGYIPFVGGWYDRQRS